MGTTKVTNETVAFEGEVRESVQSQVAYLASKGYDLTTLSAPEIMELQTRFYHEWQKSSFRKDAILSARAEKAAAKIARDAEREAARVARDEANREKVIASAKRLGILPSDVVSDASE